MADCDHRWGAWYLIGNPYGEPARLQYFERRDCDKCRVHEIRHPPLTPESEP